MNHRTTLKDIAAKAQVSVTSVSLVLNHRPTRISEEKRQLIVDIAEQLNYVPNQTARSLVTNKSMLLALLVPDIENVFFASLAKALEDETRAEGYSLIIANSDDSQASELTLLRQLQARGIDGVYLIPSAQSVEHPDTLRQTVSGLGFPAVITDRLIEGKWCDAVRSDNFEGGRIAATTLTAAGHTTIACICQSVGSDGADRRKIGFLAGLKESGLELDPALDFEGNYRFSGGYRAADAIIDHGATAVFCANDLMAIGFMQRMRERGLSCPEDCSVIGYDNAVSRYGLGTGPTTLDQNIGALAKDCHVTMMARLKQDTSEQPWLTAPVERLVKPKLVKFGTVAQHS